MRPGSLDERVVAERSEWVREMLERLRPSPGFHCRVHLRSTDPPAEKVLAHLAIPAPSTCPQLRTFEETPCTLALDGGMVEHPNKHIREAIGFAIGAGWKLRRSSARAIHGGSFCVLTLLDRGAALRCTRPPAAPRTTPVTFDEP
jgi:hypothetical protein